MNGMRRVAKGNAACLRFRWWLFPVFVSLTCVVYPPHLRGCCLQDSSVTLLHEARGYGSNTLTIDELVEAILERNIKLKLLESQTHVAVRRLESAGRIDNPELRIRNLSSRDFTDEFDEVQIGLRWRPADLGESAVEKHEAMVDFWRRKTETERYRSRLAADIREICADVILYETLAALTKKEMNLEEERLAFLKRMMDLGARTIVDLTRARLDLAEVKSDHSRIVRRLKESERTISDMVGEYSEDMFLLTEGIPEYFWDADELIEIAVHIRPEVELARHKKNLAEKENSFESKKNVPWPNFLELSWHTIQNQQDWDELRFGITLPLFNWNTGNRKAAALEVKRRDLEMVAINREIESEVRNALDVYTARLTDLNIYRSEVDPLLSDAERIIDDAREYGTLDLDDILDMELTVIEAQKALSEKSRDLARALAELYYALGVTGPEGLE